MLKQLSFSIQTYLIWCSVNFFLICSGFCQCDDKMSNLLTSAAPELK